MPAVEERPFFFQGSKKRRLFGLLHSPKDIACPAIVVFCHPFAEEKNMAHAVVTKTARAIAANGLAVFRFDLSGCGDSEGELEEVTVEDWQEDLSKAIAVAKEMTEVEKYGLWGLRLGASLATLHASRYSDLSFLMLWQPIENLKRYIHQFLRIGVGSQILEGVKNASLPSLLQKMAEEGSVTVGGYKISKLLFESFVGASDQLGLCVPRVKTLMISISLMEGLNISMEKYLDLIKTRGAPVESVHLTAEPFWDRYWRWNCPEVKEVTMKWLQELCKAGK